jgi:2-hydroxychromene-2-carboxylate isomerase
MRSAKQLRDEGHLAAARVLDWSARFGRDAVVNRKLVIDAMWIDEDTARDPEIRVEIEEALEILRGGDD